MNFAPPSTRINSIKQITTQSSYQNIYFVLRPYFIQNKCPSYKQIASPQRTNSAPQFGNLCNKGGKKLFEGKNRLSEVRYFPLNLELFSLPKLLRLLMVSASVVSLLHTVYFKFFSLRCAYISVLRTLSTFLSQIHRPHQLFPTFFHGGTPKIHIHIPRNPDL
jgi:hypothetical protein